MTQKYLSLIFPKTSSYRGLKLCVSDGTERLKISTNATREVMQTVILGCSFVSKRNPNILTDAAAQATLLYCSFHIRYNTECKLVSEFSSNERPCLPVSVSLSAQFKVHECLIQETEGVSFLCETNVIECLPATQSILCTPNLTFRRPFLPFLFLLLAFCFGNVRTKDYSRMFSVEHAIQFIASILQKGIHVLHFNFQQ